MSWCVMLLCSPYAAAPRSPSPAITAARSTCSASRCSTLVTNRKVSLASASGVASLCNNSRAISRPASTLGMPRWGTFTSCFPNHPGQPRHLVNDAQRQTKERRFERGRAEQTIPAIARCISSCEERTVTAQKSSCCPGYKR